jgi:DNA-binding NarL/FixJ family response regulator
MPTRTTAQRLSQWVELTYARQLLAPNPAKIGYLLKDRVMRSRDFVEAARRVAAGGTALDPEVVRTLLAGPSADPGLQRLTDRERSEVPRAFRTVHPLR